MYREYGGRVPTAWMCVVYLSNLSLAFCRDRGLLLCVFQFLLFWAGASLSTGSRA